MNRSLVVASPGKGALHGDGGRGEERRLIVAITDILKPRFIDPPGAQYLRVAYLQSVFLLQGVIALRLQSKLGDSIVRALLPVIHIAKRKRIAGCDLEVQARAQIHARLWIANRRRVVVACARSIEQLRINDGVRVVVPAKSTQKPRRPVVERSADVALKESGVVRWFAGHKRVQRVESRVVPAGHDHSMQAISARLGQDLNAAVTQLVVFRRERILVDSDFADRRFGMQLATRKPVNIDLAAIGAGCRTG